MREAEKTHPGRFIGLAHVPALKPPKAAGELKRCAVELGFPGVAIGSELQDQRARCRSAAALLEGVCRPGSLRVHSSAAARDPLDAHERGRSRPHARLGILADDRCGAPRQFRTARRTADPTHPVLAFRRRHRPLSRPHPRFSAARQDRHGECSRATAERRRNHSITISITDCTTTSPAGPVPITPENGAPTG